MSSSGLLDSNSNCNSAVVGAMQHALLEGAVWDELFAARPSVCSYSRTHTHDASDSDGKGVEVPQEPEEPALTAPAMARILRRVDRVVGVTSQATSAASSYASPALQLGGLIGSAEVERRYADLVRDRRVLRELLRAPGIEQRTPAWYAAREGLITASDFAQALGMGKFASQRDFFVKKVEMPPFTSGNAPALRWGVMFEPVAGELYSARSGGVRVHEFGLLRHPSIPHLGASPDGITDAGVMLEIKCPFMRRINREVPFQYYCQIQGQLAVCGLRRCDYLECEFEEYADEAEFVRDSAAASGGGGEGGLVRGRHLGYSEETGREKGVIAEYAPPPPPSNPTTEQEQEQPPPRYAYGPLPYAYESGEDYERALRAWMDERSTASASASFRFWRLKTYSVLRVEADDDMTRDMLRDLEGVWRRVLAYRDDRAAYEHEVLRKAPSSLSSSSSPSPHPPATTASWWSSTWAMTRNDNGGRGGGGGGGSGVSGGRGGRGGRGGWRGSAAAGKSPSASAAAAAAAAAPLARGEFAFLDDE